jgi:hypothetical protein
MRPNARYVRYLIPPVLWCLLLCASAHQTAYAGDVTLEWDPNTETDLTGYKVYYGTSSRTYSTPIAAGLLSTYTVTGLAPGTYYFAVTAFNADGMESAFSNEVSTTITGPDTAVPCDANGDGQADAGDVQLLIDVLFGSAATNSRYDINKDGKVNVLDIQILTNVVLGIRSCP